MEEGRAITLDFWFFESEIFIFGGFELGLEKVLGMQMTGAARVAAGDNAQRKE